jgi:hypothetical protein
MAKCKKEDLTKYRKTWKPTPCIHNQIRQLCPHCKKGETMNSFDNENYHKDILAERESNQPPHTPTPWNYDDENGRVYDNEAGELVAVCDFVPDAAFIVKAVNSHEELVDTLRFILEMDAKQGADRNMPVAIRLAKQVLAKAEGKE